MGGEQIVTVLMAGPLYALAAIQVFGPHRLWSGESLRIFIWGALYAVLSYPFWTLVGLIEIQSPGYGPYLEMGLRQIRVWLIIFTLTALGRLGVMMVKYVWRRRPRHTPPASSSTRSDVTTPAPPRIEGDRTGVHH